jgi:hypothetical protein
VGQSLREKPSGRSGAAEKDDERMALKILTRAGDMPDGKDNLEIHAHTKWKRAILFNFFFVTLRNTNPQKNSIRRSFAAAPR